MGLSQSSAFSNATLYHASLSPLNDSGVMGTVVVIGHGSVVAYAGSAANLQSNLGPSDCTATNGCGVHVHAGFSCANSTVQQGHYYYNESGAADPWLTERYSSTGLGTAKYSGVANIASTADLEGRAFIVHDSTGSRVACGLLQAVSPKHVFETATTPLSGGSVTSEAVLATGIPGTDEGQVCFYGNALALESNLQTFLVAGPDCNSTNGCGVHVHSGTSCEPDEQLGHFYNNESLTADPWVLVGYETTTDTGTGFFADCVNTGVDNLVDYQGRAFIVHASNGSRQSCGIISGVFDAPGAAGGGTLSTSMGWNKGYDQLLVAPSFLFLIIFLLM